MLKIKKVRVQYPNRSSKFVYIPKNVPFDKPFQRGEELNLFLLDEDTIIISRKDKLSLEVERKVERKSENVDKVSEKLKKLKQCLVNMSELLDFLGQQNREALLQWIRENRDKWKSIQECVKGELR